MPPSILLVVYGILVEQPIGRLLIAGVIPSFVFAIAISLYIWLMAKRYPALCPRDSRKVPWRERIISLKGAWAIVALAAIVLGGIYTGIFSPTEAAAAGSFAACVFCILARKLNFSTLRTVLFETLEITVMLFFVLIGASIFSRFLAMSGFSAFLLNSLVDMELPRVVLLIGVLAIYVFLGCFIDNISIMAITLPIVFPAITAHGYDGVWFGIILLIAMLIGAMTPPFGLSVFAVKSVVKAEIDIEDMFRGTIPFIIMTMVVWLIMIVFPQISLFLPNMILTR
jgi:tripartite ATP-independent transporter DctM subunit